MNDRRRATRGIIAVVAVGLVLAACSSDASDTPAAPAPTPPATDQPGAVEDIAFPERPITIIVPYGAGGGVDITARILASNLGLYLGQNVIVQNLTGGGGAIGFSAVANADPDGYTLLLGATPLVHHEYLRAGEVDYGRESFEYIYNLTDVPHNLIVRCDIAAEFNGDVLAYMDALRADPENQIMGVGGQWATMDVSRAILENTAGIKFTRVVYPGGGPTILAMLAGDVDAAMLYADEAGEQVRAGELCPLAVAGDARLTAEGFESVPTFLELGLDVQAGTWRGILAPAGTPEAILAKIEAAIDATVADPVFIQAMNEAGIPIITFNRAQFPALLDRDHAASQTAASTLLDEIAAAG
jgi:tripartite-type tricarboxylate transporter receptor subunit TctC